VTPPLDDEVAALNNVFGGAELLSVPGRHIVHLPSLGLPDPQWQPQTVRGLLVCDAWPDQRPQLLVEDTLLRRGQAPVNFNRQFIADEGWFGFSFQAPYDSRHPALVPVLRGWLRRFDGRSD